MEQLYKSAQESSSGAIAMNEIAPEMETGGTPIFGNVVVRVVRPASGQPVASDTDESSDSDHDTLDDEDWAKVRVEVEAFADTL